MLMDVPSNNNKTLDGFYNELRRKYPDAFTLATDLGRRNGSLQKLPCLEKTPSPVLGIPPNPPIMASPQRWSPDSFLSKVKYQKTHNEQRKEVERSQQSGNAVIIKDQAIPIPTWTRKDYLEAQNGASFHLPTLRTQIEQNKVELKNRFNPPKKTDVESKTNDSSTLQTNNDVQAKTSKDYTTTKTTNDYTITKTTNDYTYRDYTTTKTTNKYPTRDNTSIKTTNDYRTRYDTPTKTTNDYPPRDYTNIKTINDYPIRNVTTTKTTKDQTNINYSITKTSDDYPTKDYTNKNTINDYPTRDYSNTTTTNDYPTRNFTTTKTTNDHTNINDSITKTSDDYPTKDYTNTHTINEYPTRDYSNTRTTNDYPTRNFTTTKTTNDHTNINYSITKTSDDYPTKDYTNTHTINDYPTRYYSNTRTTNDYPIRDYTTTKITNNYSTSNTTRDYTTIKTPNAYTTTKTMKHYTTSGDSSSLRTNVSGAKSDTLGTIMKELLPNKPSQLMKDLPITTNRLSINGGFISDSDSGVSVCSPMKLFRPKIRSPQAPPASRDIRKKFSAKPQRTSEPLKGDHSLVQENVTQIVKKKEDPVTRYSKKSSINFNEKLPQSPPRSRVHFQDELEEDAEFRYQERCLLERTQTTELSTNISSGLQIKYMERNTKSETTEKSSTPLNESEKPTRTDKQMMTLPHRRQPFPPSVAKKVLIDIPRGGLPSRRVAQIRIPPVMRNSYNKQFSPRNVTSIDGITMSFTSPNHEWGEQSQSIKSTREDERGHNSLLSSLETLESGTTEVSSEVWRDSSSSMGSGNQSRSSSQNHDLNLDHTKQNKGAEISFYSKLRRSLRLKKKQSPEPAILSRHSDFIPKTSKDLELDQSSYTSIQSDGGEKVHGKSSPHGAAICRLPNQTAANDRIPSGVGMNRMKKDIMEDTQETERPYPVKVPYSPMRMMQSLLKKGRAKDYLVRAPSPPPLESRPPQSRQPTASNEYSSRYRREHIPGRESGRVLAIQSDSSRLVELERPRMGFSGLYLTKKNQNGYSGLYVVQLSGAFTSSFPQGILEVGDEILEINRIQAKDLRLDEIYTLLEESSCVLLRASRNDSSSSS